MHVRLILTLLLLVPSVFIGAPADLRAQASDHATTAAVLADLSKLAGQAHKRGDVEEEIALRQSYSQKAWAAFALNSKSSDEYDRYYIICFNDLPLGLLLEGTRRFAEAEVVFRRNQAELAAERVAGNDIKSENQLQLARLLAREGKDQEATNICSHWKGRMRHLAAGQDSAHIYGIPRAPISDTPEVKVASWDLACGKAVEGLELIEEQISVHPQMLVSFTVLRDYYYAQGDFQRARKAESDGTSAVTGH
jgi:hypothetical protein